MTKKYLLPEWTLKVLEITGWSQAELAQRSGLSRTSINDVINRKVRGGYKYAMAVAEAAELPIEDGLQAAGILDLPVNQNEKLKELTHLANQMNADTIDDTIDYAKLKLNKQKKGNKNGKRERTN